MSSDDGKEKLNLLPALKGAPICILYALHFFQGTMTNRQLINTTGYSDKTISAGTEKLKAKGLIRRSVGGWAMSTNFFEVGKFPTQDSELFHPHGNSTSTTTALKDTRFPNEIAVIDTRKNSVLKQLHAAKIFEPTASKLVELDHVTEEYVRDHVNYGKKHNEGIGLVITRIQNGEPVPVKENYPKTKQNLPKQTIRGSDVEQAVSDFFNR
jgi:hypothetical protein